MINQIDLSYQKHRENEKKTLEAGDLPSCYINPEIIDNWRHERMCKYILPLVEHNQNTKWITIGDGTFGTDAYFLQNRGLDVLATSISDETLSKAHELGYIKKYKAVNAEAISEDDNSFDFVFCKEAYHHFPRPPIALYEMIRVSRTGVILIEPQENGLKLLNFFKKFIKYYLRKDASLYYEPLGNFIFRINIKETAKMMTALNLKYLAYKRFNDFFFPSFSFKTSKGFGWAKILTLAAIGIQNLLCKLKLLDFGLAVVILFKNDVNEELLSQLSKKGYTIRKLPKNPYI